MDCIYDRLGRTIITRRTLCFINPSDHRQLYRVWVYTELNFCVLRRDSGISHLDPAPKRRRLSASRRLGVGFWRDNIGNAGVSKCGWSFAPASHGKRYHVHGNADTNCGKTHLGTKLGLCTGKSRSKDHRSLSLCSPSCVCRVFIDAYCIFIDESNCMEFDNLCVVLYISNLTSSGRGTVVVQGRKLCRVHDHRSISIDPGSVLDCQSLYIKVFSVTSSFLHCNLIA